MTVSLNPNPTSDYVPPTDLIELRRHEEVFSMKAASVARKFASGSKAVGREDVFRVSSELALVRAALSEHGLDPIRTPEEVAQFLQAQDSRA